MIRTCDLLVRSQTLYPAELWARQTFDLNRNKRACQSMISMLSRQAAASVQFSTLKSPGPFYTRDPETGLEDHMSARNGQRARFHRNRKRRVIRLMRLRTVMAELKKKAAGAS
jgi:hypothetical protein